MEHQDTKREQFGSSGVAGGGTVGATGSADAASPPAALVKAEVYTPLYMVPTGLHYRAEGDEAARVIYESNPYEVTPVSHSSYMKNDQQSPPDSPYEEERDGVRKVDLNIFEKTHKAQFQSSSIQHLELYQTQLCCTAPCRQNIYEHSLVLIFLQCVCGWFKELMEI